MPISKYNPDGTVNIYNSKTGEIKTNVAPEQLGAISPNLAVEYERNKAAIEAYSSTNDISVIPEGQKPTIISGAISQGYEAPKTEEEQKQQTVDENAKAGLYLANQLGTQDYGKITGLKGPGAWVKHKGFLGLGEKTEEPKFPGASAQETLSTYTQLKGILDLAKRGELKGSGTISDFEMQILSNAASGLNQNLSNEAFGKKLAEVKVALSPDFELTPTGVVNRNTGKQVSLEEADRQITTGNIDMGEVTEEVQSEVLSEAASSETLGSTASIFEPAIKEKKNTARDILETPVNIPPWLERQMSIASQETPATSLSLPKRKEEALARGEEIKEVSLMDFAVNFANGLINIVGGTAALLGDISPIAKLKIDPDTGKVAVLNPITGETKGEVIKGMVDVPANMLNLMYQLGRDPLSAIYNKPVEQGLSIYGTSQLLKPIVESPNAPNFFSKKPPKLGEATSVSAEIPTAGGNQPSGDIVGNIVKQIDDMDPKNIFGSKQAELAAQNIPVDNSSILQAGDDIINMNPEVKAINEKYNWQGSVEKINNSADLLNNLKVWGDNAFTSSGNIGARASSKLQFQYWKAGWNIMKEIAPEVAKYQTLLKWSYKIPTLSKLLWKGALAKIIFM